MNTGFTFNPSVGAYRPLLRRLCVRIQASGRPQSEARQNEIANARSELLDIDRFGLSNNELRFTASISVLLDLLEQGWDLKVQPKGVRLTPRSEQNEEPSKNKARVRHGHLVNRTAHIRQPAVRRFIESMESPQLTGDGWHSIYSLMRDGRELADRLRNVRRLSDSKAIANELATAIDPYLQVVESDARCRFTGLSLNDIWRYFRYTWVNPPQSVPGRSLRFLVRDRAAQNHPVIGLAALGSSMAQQTVRDQWIGWEGPRLNQWIQSKSESELTSWIDCTLSRLIRSIYVGDFLHEGVITRKEINKPTTEAIARLETTAARAVKKHRLHPHLATHKDATKRATASRWRAQARTSLFRAKRARTLARLLGIRRTVEEVANSPARNRQSATITRKAASQVARFVKSEHIGLNMMDITTCGAIAPYNHLLGGKLVCLLLASPEVRRCYARRYETRPSIIASSMRGQAVLRSCELVLLMTTSLFGSSSSQYNRINVRASEITGRASQHNVQYLLLGRSIGFGSHHFSQVSTTLMEQLIGRASEGRKVNSIFGEGVNPLMRKIRDALLLLGLPGDLLRHGNPRIVYAVPLAKNFREVLLGEETKPRYHLQSSTKTARLVAHWRARWLAKRIQRDEVLDKVSAETLTYPIMHNGCVRRDLGDDETHLSHPARESPLAKAG